MNQELKDKLKAEGLDFAEETVKDIAENAFKAIKAIIKATPNTFDDISLPLIDLAEKALMPIIDKIDGEAN